MATATLTSSTWSALPNLRTFSVSEGLKLMFTVGCLSIIFLAGQLAQSRGADLTEAQASRIVTAVATQSKPQVAHRLTPAERFARSQIKMFTETLDGLTERAEILIATTNVSPSDATDLKNSLLQLDQDLMGAREAYARFSKKGDKFNEEDLRESLMAVQDSASRAQGQLITLDQPAQSFKVTRTGQ